MKMGVEMKRRINISAAGLMAIGLNTACLKSDLKFAGKILVKQTLTVYV